MTYPELINCVILELDPDQFAEYQLRDVISKYRKKARQVHPDKFVDATEEQKKIKTAEFQALNNAYERILKYILETQKNQPDEETDDEERFMKANFGKFNFPKENNGSFTVVIQHCDADIWQKCLVEKYGEPQVIINNQGTVCDTLWRFSYEDDRRTTDLTLHIYNKPKTKKDSKLLI